MTDAIDHFADGENMVFVCGVPRSGTTLLQRIFGGHSRVYAGPEFDFVPQIIQGVRRQMQASIESGRIAPLVDNLGLDRAFGAFFASIFYDKIKDGPETVFCEKTPATALVLEELVALFPKARIVVMMRDPVDVANSMKQVKARQLAEGVRPVRFVRSVAGSVASFNQYMSIVLPAARAHEQISLSYYTDLVTDPDAEVRRLCTHIGLPFEPEMLAIDRHEQVYPKTEDETWYSNEELTKPITASGVVTKDRLLSEDEIAMVRTKVDSWPELDRFTLSDRPLNMKQKLKWWVEKAKVHGIFLPRHSR